MTVTAPATHHQTDWRLETLAGIGPKTLASLQEAGITNRWQLLCFAPNRYEDYTTLVPAVHWLDHLNKDAILIEGTVGKTWSFFSVGKRMTYCQLEHEALSIRVGFFHLHPQIKKQFTREGAKLRCFGKLVLSGKVVSMYHPKYWVIDPQSTKPLETALTPVYKSIPGVSAARLQKIIKTALQDLPDMASLLVEDKTASSLSAALQQIHQPKPHQSLAQQQQALAVLAKEEALAWCAYLLQRPQQQQAAYICFPAAKTLTQKLLASLPFALTEGQQQAWQDIALDLQQPVPMRRLVQGDVGCGKTVVAMLAMLQAIEAGYQAALLAPTTVLAKQHAATLNQYLQPLGVHVTCLLSETGDAAKQKKTYISNGSVQCIVGTHALLSASVQFKQLGLVVVDEQHRFGVNQREQLLQKGVQANAHALLMSATPIPRTLAQSFFQVTACSSIRSLPQGRKPTITSLLSTDKRQALIKRIIEQAQAGKQVYWICPRVDNQDEAGKSAIDMFEQIQQQAGAIPCALLHGRMKAEQKSQILERFAQGEVLVLISTVVIEVGVDVPNANIMVIDHAQTYGLAQLHQLRGRVGRSDQQGYCVLVYDHAITEEGVERLQALRDCHDGFVLAEKDLAMRGPGEVLGLQQSGCPAWRFLQWPQHQQLLAESQQQLAGKSLNKDKKYLASVLWGFASVP